MAQLLGVAGTDVPLSDIQKHAPPYMVRKGGREHTVNHVAGVATGLAVSAAQCCFVVTCEPACYLNSMIEFIPRELRSYEMDTSAQLLN